MSKVALTRNDILYLNTRFGVMLILENILNIIYRRIMFDDTAGTYHI